MSWLLVADTQLYMRLVRPLAISQCVSLSVGPSVGPSRSKNTAVGILYVCLCWRGVAGGDGVSMGVLCPFPPVCNDIVTPDHLLPQGSVVSFTRKRGRPKPDATY